MIGSIQFKASIVLALILLLLSALAANDAGVIDGVLHHYRSGNYEAIEMPDVESDWWFIADFAIER